MENRELVDANFDLEQGILRCWNMTSDLTEVIEDVKAGVMSADEAVNILESFARVYDNRFDRTWRLYETVCRGLHDLRRARQVESTVDFDPLLDGVVQKPQTKGQKRSKKG